MLFFHFITVYVEPPEVLVQHRRPATRGAHMTHESAAITHNALVSDTGAFL